jgi:hypothetical protein
MKERAQRSTRPNILEQDGLAVGGARRAGKAFRYAAIIVLGLCQSFIHPCWASAPSAPAQKSVSRSSKTERISYSAIQIEPMDSSESKVPPDFSVAVYENLIEQVAKTHKFEHVYRSGDRRAADAPDLLVLRSHVESFKHGSELQRDVTTVSGATSLKLRVQVETRDGRKLVDQDVQGKVRFIGGNLGATLDLSKKVARILSQTF